jgi:hypothetical protein
MNMPVSITLVVKFFVTAAIFQLFKNLVTDFKSHSRLQKADRLVGILPIWPPISQFVYRATDSISSPVQNVKIFQLITAFSSPPRRFLSPQR